MSWKQFKWIGLAVIVFVPSGCLDKGTAPSPAPIGMSNPASDNCAELGGKTVIETIDGGDQVGMCHLPDGRVCNEWPLYREGVCEPLDAAG